MKIPTVFIEAVMNNRRKLLMRTDIFEQIVIRSKRRTLNSGAATEDPIPGSEGVGKYRMEIYRIEIGGAEKVFECELTDSIESCRSDRESPSTD
jgi:hypothetical protein